MHRSVVLMWLLYIVVVTKNFVYSMDDQSRGSKNVSKNERERQSKKLTEVDIKMRESTESFTCVVSGQVAMYQVREGYLIDSVRQHDSEIWRYCGGEFCSKVIVDGIGKGEKNVTIHFENKQTRVFNKPGRKKSWSEVSNIGDVVGQSPSKKGLDDKEGGSGEAIDRDMASSSGNMTELPVSECPSEIEIITIDDDRIGACGGERGDKFKLMKHQTLNIYEFHMNEGSKCVEVRYQGEKVWAHEEGKEHPKSIDVRMSEKNMVIRFESSFSFYVQRDNKWVLHPYLQKHKVLTLTRNRYGGSRRDPKK